MPGPFVLKLYNKSGSRHEPIVQARGALPSVGASRKVGCCGVALATLTAPSFKCWPSQNPEDFLTFHHVDMTMSAFFIFCF